MSETNTFKFNGTPGPWYVIDSTLPHPDRPGKRTGTFDIVTKEIYEPGIRVIGDAKPYEGNFPSPEEAKANAQLMAAAPELLQAAQYALECLDRLYDEIGQIGDNGDQAYNALKSAIEKATNSEALEGTCALAD